MDLIVNKINNESDALATATLWGAIAWMQDTDVNRTRTKWTSQQRLGRRQVGHEPKWMQWMGKHGRCTEAV